MFERGGYDVKLFDTTFYHTEEKSFDEESYELLKVKSCSYADMGIQLNEGDIFHDLRKCVAEYRPDLIGISLVEESLELGMQLLEAIHEFHIPVQAGGISAYFEADRLISSEFIDIVCVGEGEGAIVDLCDAMSEGRDYSHIPNLWIKGADGTVTKNPPRELVSLNELPYLDYDIFNEKRMYRPMNGKLRKMLHVESQRGCPFACTYCCSPAIKRFYSSNGIEGYYRQKNPERFVAELKYLKDKYHPDYVNIEAESFLAVTEKELRTFAGLYKEQIGLPFWCQSRVETVTEEKIKILKEAGCSDIQFGIEHGNPEFRKKMLNRLYTNEQAIEAIGSVEKYGIPYTVNNIIGFPDETRELVFDTIELNRNFKKAKTYNCFIATPYKGSLLREICIDRGFLEEDAKSTGLNHGADYKFEKLTLEQLQGLLRCFSLYVRFGKERWKEIKIAERLDEEGNAMFSKLADEYRKLYM